MKIKYFIDPGFLERESITESISYLLNKYKHKIEGRKLLDIGCGSKPYAFLFKELNITYEGIDFKNYSSNYSYELNNPDFYFERNYKKDYKLSQFKNGSYYIVTAFQVLEHHENVNMFFSEAGRILKKGGYLIISFPFIWELHEEPNDFQRLTHYKIKKLSQENNMRIVETVKRGGALSTIIQLTNLALFNTKLPKLIKKSAYLLFLLPLQWFACIYEKLFSNREGKIFLGYTILIRK